MHMILGLVLVSFTLSCVYRFQVVGGNLVFCWPPMPTSDIDSFCMFAIGNFLFSERFAKSAS